MKSLFRKILFGDTEIREYSTVTIAGEIKEHVFLKSGKFTIDISKTHWVLCLEPIVFGLTGGASFVRSSTTPNEG